MRYIAAALLIGGCGGPGDDGADPGTVAPLETVGAPTPGEMASPADPAPADRPGGPRWAEAPGGGPALHLLGRDGALRLSIACLAAPPRLVVHVPAFRPIGSEDRFVLALGEEPVTLVADPTRQPLGDGVEGEGPIPADLRALWRRAQGIGALYGNQRIEPEAPPPPALAAALLDGCEQLRP
jgi:hypothetical protein